MNECELHSFYMCTEAAQGVWEGERGRVMEFRQLLKLGSFRKCTKASSGICTGVRVRECLQVYARELRSSYGWANANLGV